MFQVVPEPEFSAWYAALAEPIAEEVATAIDLVASAGAVLAPERLSRLLLWYDGTGSGADLEELGGLTLAPHAQLPAELVRSYLMWQQEVVLCLESTLFQERLAQLEPALGRQALLQVERLKRRLQAARFSGSLGAWRGAGQRAAEPRSDAGGVRAAFLDLLELVGLEPRLALGSGSGLRELAIPNVKPQLRVLFGLDFPAKRLLAILGETLDRSYYGDSVRHAEARWRAYSEQVAQRLAEAP